MGRACNDAPDATGPDLPALLDAAIEAIRARGGASPGDKTALDALDALSHALHSADPDDFPTAAPAATADALAAFREKPCRLGRARMFAERSVGLDDPGMLAIHRVVEIISS